MTVLRPEERVLIVAPLGQDAATMAALLQAESISTFSCSDPTECARQLAGGAAALLMTEEALELPRVPDLLERLKTQPPWSELPLIILTTGGESRLAGLLDLTASSAGAITLLERPMSAATLLRSVQVALHSRSRQYQVRDLLAEQRRQHALLKAYQQELERLVTERTGRLQELVNELEHFSYSITHDMRAPLRAMAGFADMAVELCGSSQVEEQRRLLQRISQSTTRMDALITDALSYSEAIRKHLPLAPVDANLLLRGMLDCYPEFQSTRAHIQVQPGIPEVFANEAGLTQCFSNLLNNSIKFTPAGRTPEIRIWAERAERSPEPSPDPLAGPKPFQPSGFAPVPSLPAPVHGENRHRWVRIWIEDHGIGISESMLPRVFNMFSRGSTGHVGTGIGLALVRKVVDRMGGRVGVQSEEGKGTRFWIELLSAECL